MKVMLVISYDGSKFNGFQRQNDVRNVQGYLESELANYFKEDIKIKGSSRTDRGVHAKYQVVHFITDNEVTNLKKDLNRILKDLKIKKVKVVKDDFHARHSVRNKTYLYKIDLSNKREQNYYLRMPYKLNINKMKEAASILIGTHNFKNFVSGKQKNYETTIYKIKIFKFNNILYLKFKGTGFYRYMIRNLVGALIHVGKGKCDKDTIKNMLDNFDIPKSLPTVLANGLYLIKINY